MGRPAFSEDRIEQTRRRLCLIALELYRREGYEAVSLRELGKLASLSHATLYRYFSSKDDLFMHARAEVFRQLGEHIQGRDPKDAAPLSRLRRVAISLAEFGRSAPEDYRLIFSMRQAATDAGSELAMARAQVLAHVVSICELAIDAGQIGEDAITQAHLIWTGVHGLLTLHVSNLLINGRSLDELLPKIVDRLFARTV